MIGLLNNYKWITLINVLYIENNILFSFVFKLRQLYFNNVILIEKLLYLYIIACAFPFILYYFFRQYAIHYFSRLVIINI